MECIGVGIQGSDAEELYRCTSQSENEQDRAREREREMDGEKETENEIIQAKYKSMRLQIVLKQFQDRSEQLHGRTLEQK